MTDNTELFGTMIFGDSVMREKLPKDTYSALKETVRMGKPLAPDVAGVVANAMKDWAVEKGATHFTHWFQPLTGVTAEKHDSFLSPSKDGTPILEFSAKELIKSEPDASSFPSGGLRPTFEARGYTAWDPTSYAFIKDGTLCIPTCFFSYSGEALDKKTPLLRSMELINRQAMRILRLFGHTDVRGVIPTVGAEQEYFLVEKSLFDKRRDLVYCQRTLFGAKPPKGQELDDHYFGAIQPRVAAFMRDLDCELWKLGVYAKTEHKEVAPGQHELACVYASCNIATDQNQLVMELMKQVALRHGMVCLLHEKPFMRLNGSGKHNNWSLATDTGINLLEPGKDPASNTMFLVFMASIIKAVDEYQDMLRVCVAGAGNDCRLGGQEAPPAIISMYVGEDLEDLFSRIEHDDECAALTRRTLDNGTAVVPRIRQDTTDRNRTSPLAFTGNKFEFRMPGSSHSIADPNTVLNTIVADTLKGFACELEKSDDLHSDAIKLVQRTIRAHKRILYGGNCYSGQWKSEAKLRGLLDLPTTADALPMFIADKNIKLFVENGIFSEVEMRSRYEVLLENYVKVVSIEAKTMLEMTYRDILPAAVAYQKRMADSILSKGTLNVSAKPETEILERLSRLCDKLLESAHALDDELEKIKHFEDDLSAASSVRDGLIPAMAELREVADKLEVITVRQLWPFPTYEELLFNMI